MNSISKKILANGSICAIMAIGSIVLTRMYVKSVDKEVDKVKDEIDEMNKEADERDKRMNEMIKKAGELTETALRDLEELKQKAIQKNNMKEGI